MFTPELFDEVAEAMIHGDKRAKRGEFDGLRELLQAREGEGMARRAHASENDRRFGRCWECLRLGRNEAEEEWYHRATTGRGEGMKDKAYPSKVTVLRTLAGDCVATKEPIRGISFGFNVEHRMDGGYFYQLHTFDAHYFDPELCVFDERHHKGVPPVTRAQLEEWCTVSGARLVRLGLRDGKLTILSGGFIGKGPAKVEPEFILKVNLPDKAPNDAMERAVNRAMAGGDFAAPMASIAEEEGGDPRRTRRELALCRAQLDAARAELELKKFDAHQHSGAMHSRLKQQTEKVDGAVRLLREVRDAMAKARAARGKVARKDARVLLLAMMGRIASLYPAAAE